MQTSSLEAARQYRERGWSVIPLMGKSPRIQSWKAYQSKPASDAQIERWFKRDANIGIITGQVSGIIVLDIDDSSLESSFKSALPCLANTLSIRTPGRHGLHLVFAVSFPVKSRKWRGADLQADGSYVVAPPSAINGSRYLVENETSPLQLDESDLLNLLFFFGNTVTPDCDDTPALQLQSPSRPQASDSSTYAAAVASYQHRVAALGSRNRALFLTSCALRDRGWHQEWTEGALARVHAMAEPATDHAPESYERRHKEAQLTIASAYTRPPRPARRAAPDNITHIAFSDNLARETLLQRDKVEGTAFWRCYDGLIIAGFTVGQRFSYGDAFAALAPHKVGRRAINRFLAAVGSTGEFLVSHDPSPAPHHAEPDTDVLISDSKSNLNSQSLRIVHTTKRSLNRGREHNRRFTLPSMDEICSRLDIERSAGDPITAGDIASPRKYRAVLEREFIRRRPGRYSLGLLADRLNVSKRSIQRYHAREGVESLPTYETIAQVVLSDLDVIPMTPRGEPSKFFLEDEHGNRFPARTETATWLIADGRRVMLRARSYNLYYVGTPPDELSAALPTPATHDDTMTFEEERRERIERISELLQERDQIRAGWIQPVTPTLKQIPLPYSIEPTPAPGLTPPAAASHPHEKPRRKTKRYYRQPLPDARMEQLAQRVYKFTAGPKGMALYNSRRLVETYGHTAVQRALQRAWWIEQGDQALRSRSGFIVATASAEWRKLNPTATQRPQFEAEKKRKGRSKYDVTQDAFWHSLRTLLLWSDEGYQAWRAEFFASLGMDDYAQLDSNPF